MSSYKSEMDVNDEREIVDIGTRSYLLTLLLKVCMHFLIIHEYDYSLRN